MKRGGTHRYVMKYAGTSIQINGTSYYLLAELAHKLGVSRTTMWRWRKEGKIPVGRRFRDGRILVTQSEVEEIVRFANSLEPARPGDDPTQLKLFHSQGKGGSR